MIRTRLIELTAVLGVISAAGCTQQPAANQPGIPPAVGGIGTSPTGSLAPKGGASGSVTPPVQPVADMPGTGPGTAAVAGSAAAGGAPATGSVTTPPSGGTGAVPPSGSMAGAGASGSSEAPVMCSGMKLPAGNMTMMTPVGGRDGGMRTYYVHIPASYDGTKPVPLMINFHPLIFGTGMGQLTGSGWAQIGDQDGIITAFPDGYDAAWDIGNCCTRGDVDDMAFAMAIVDEIKKMACIDTNRIYASGYSMGAGFSHLLGCKKSDVFAAIAPSAFDLTKENHIPCEPTRPLTVYMHRSMSDGVVPWNGGPTQPPNGTPVTVTMLGAVGTFDEWSKINGCTDEPVVEGNCRRRSKCKDGVEVVLCENSGHTEGPAPKIWESLKKHGLHGPL